MYYTEGHATLQHDEPGWEGGRIWLFFQNVSQAEWGHFNKNQRAQDILTALTAIIKANPNLSMKGLFANYVGKHLKGRTLGAAITNRVQDPKDEEQTARLILAAELLGEYGT